MPLSSIGKEGEPTPGSLSAAAALRDFRVATRTLSVAERYSAVGYPSYSRAI
jgi:hypothetical protein